MSEFMAALATERLLRTHTSRVRPEEYLARLDRDLLDALDGAELAAIRPQRLP